MARPKQLVAKIQKTWADTAGAGDRDGAFLGISGRAGQSVAWTGAMLLMVLCPAVVVYVYAFAGSSNAYCRAVGDSSESCCVRCRAVANHHAAHGQSQA